MAMSTLCGVQSPPWEFSLVMHLLISSTILLYSFMVKSTSSTSGIESSTSSDMNGTLSGANAARTAEAKAGPTPFRLESALTADSRSSLFEMARKDFLVRFITTRGVFIWMRSFSLARKTPMWSFHFIHWTISSWVR